MANTTRTFIAVEVPPRLARNLGRLRLELEPEAPGVRWVEGVHHLTLAFLGDVGHADLAGLCRGVGEAVAGLAPFDLKLEGLGAFPGPHKPRVLWVGATGPGADAIVALQGVVAAAAHRVGYPPDDKRFNPHVTLGRIKPGRGPGFDAAPLLDRHRSYTPGTFRVGEVVTFSSTLDPDGPLYAALARAPLRGKTG